MILIQMKIIHLYLSKFKIYYYFFIYNLFIYIIYIFMRYDNTLFLLNNNINNYDYKNRYNKYFNLCQLFGFLFFIIILLIAFYDIIINL
jgi:hypothetical protein